MKWLGHVLPETWLFRSGRVAASIEFKISPHAKRFLRPLRQVLDGSKNHREADGIARQYLIYRKYLNYLEVAWTHPAVKQKVPVTIAGREHLDAALASGQGAVLVSGHAYGFNRLVAPVLARYGYPTIRSGMVKPEVLKTLSGTRQEDSWGYVYLGRSPWERLRALRRIERSLNQNELLHTLVAGRPHPQAESEMRFFGRRFSLDLPTLRFISELKRPLLPCFALCDGGGRLLIEIHPPLSPMPELAREFIALFQGYLHNHPEFVRFWKRLNNGRPYF